MKNQIKGKINMGVHIEKKSDLYEYRVAYQRGMIQLNLSEIGRVLNLDRRTVKSILTTTDEDLKRKAKNERNKLSKLDKHETFIYHLLTDPKKRFVYKRHLYNYMVKSGRISVSYSAFTHWLRKRADLLELIESHPKSSITYRISTQVGKEAQLDWKEDIPIVLNTGKTVKVNILVLILSHSRMRVARMTTNKSQSVLIHLLVEMFEELGGIPHSIRCDNMKTIMDKPRTENYGGELNVTFAQFAADFGFEIIPCIAYQPQRKGHVEQPNRLFEALPNYNGELTLKQFNKLVHDIVDEQNNIFHPSYQMTPAVEFQLEKKALITLPKKEIRTFYKITTVQRVVDRASLITFENHKYSVPPEYIGKTVLVRKIEDVIQIYSNTNEQELLHIHLANDHASNSEFTYDLEHKKAITALKFGTFDKEIDDITSRNLYALDKALERKNEQ